MPTLSELAAASADSGTPLVLAIKAARLQEKLPLLSFTQTEIEHAIDSPRILRTLVRLSSTGEEGSGYPGELAAQLAHELKVMAHLIGQGIPDLGSEDMLTMDLDAEVMAYQIAPMLELAYLSDAIERRVDEVQGKLHGAHHRHFVGLPVSNNEESNAYMVPFLVDTGAPATYVNKDVWEKLGHTEALPQRTFLVINGVGVEAHLAVGHNFEGINILGTDVLSKCEELVVNYRLMKVTLRF